MDFAKRYPEVALEIVSTDRQVDLVSEGFDVAVRAGKLADSSLIARPLASVERIVMASARYLKRRGRPRVPADLERHDALVFGAGENPTTWQLRNAATTVRVDVKPRLTINDFEALRQAACADLGVVLVPIFLGVEEVRVRRLERILKEWSSIPNVIHAVYPSTRHLSPKVKAFVEHLQERFSPPPWEVV
jgi:DNA-binding transcriptional LysR family regulator